MNALRSWLLPGPKTRLRPWLARLAVSLGLLATSALLLAGCGKAGGDWQLPQEASAQAAETDWVYYFIFWTNVVYFVHIVIAMGVLMVKYRRRPGVEPQKSPHHNLALEIGWSIPPIILVVLFFYFGFTQYLNLQTPPADAIKVEVTAKKWDWQFRYPNGTVSKDLHVLKDQPFRMLLQSQDVLHAFYIPKFRVKQDVVPGRTTSLWFTPTQPTGEGEHYWLFCAEYCGTNHSRMWAKVIVHADQASYDKAIEPKALEGPDLYALYCQSCHNLEGTINVGPTFAGVFGSKRKVLDTETGKEEEVTADEAYIRESILYPGKKLSRMGREFPNGMDPTLKDRLKPEEVDKLVAFIKGLK